MNKVKQILIKEFKEDFRQKSLIGSVLLYVVSTIFVCFLAFKRIADVPTWNVLLWIILLFATVNTVSSSIGKLRKNHYVYLYTLIPARTQIISQIIYNCSFMTIIALISYLFYAIFLGDLVQNHIMFLITLLLGVLGLSSIFTLVGSIASKTSGGLGLTAILGFPITLPLLLTTIRASKNAIDGLDWSVNMKYMTAQGGIIVIIIMLSYLLFPYLWRD